MRFSPVPFKKRFVVIMAGGVGSRFWPLSREDRPKQLLRLVGSKSMLQQAAQRVRRLVPIENLLVVTSVRLRKAVIADLPWLPKTCVFAEPEGRNTAPCVGWAALEVRCRESDGVMVVLAADHLVSPQARFLADLRRALSVAWHEKRLVTFGIVPTEPSTGYGYIRAGKVFGQGAREAVAFHEKPAAKVAKRYVADPDFFWNSGMFAWRADTILREIQASLPALYDGLMALEKSRTRGRIPAAVLARGYPALPSISVDHGVMESSRRVAVLTASFEWSDVGSWDALHDLLPDDGNGNHSRDPMTALDSTGNLVFSGGKPVALVGVEGLVVVDSGDALLVCRRDRSQEVREVVSRLKSTGNKKLL
ncbi:MAG: mannose-1-phosphate guanylyltransferase [Candidatus Binatia bacterium]